MSFDEIINTTPTLSKSVHQALEILKVGVNQPSFKQDTNIKKLQIK